MFAIDPLYPTFLATGLAVGLGHCTGMCGPIVVTLSLKLEGRKALGPQALYHAGRLFTYTLLGAAMGASGAFTQLAARLEAFQRGALAAAGLLVVVMGLSAGGWLRLPRVTGAGGGAAAGWAGRLLRARATAAYLPLGMLLGLLPCGPVYTALLAAAGAGMQDGSPAAGALRGAALLAAFGLGTLPALVLVGRLAAAGWIKRRRALFRAGALLMVGVGVFFVLRALRY